MMLIGAVVAAGKVLLPLLALVLFIVMVTGIVALVRRTRTWLRLPNRTAALWVTALSTVAFLITAGLAGTTLSGADEEALGASGSFPTVAETASPESPTAAPPASTTPTAAPTPTPTADPVDAETTDEAFDGEAGTVSDTEATAGQTALAVLATLEVKGRAPKTGYDRDQFGQRWLDIDRNGCDTRNDILARDLTSITKSGPCKVLTGVLADPFTATAIDFVRGQDTSADVQIDHVVALSDAWQKGAQQLTADQRTTFANDPLNLLAVDGRANAQKGDGDAATWLPSNKAFRCAYVARQVSVKATYGLWVTQAEHDAIERILSRCPNEPAVTSAYAAQPAPEPQPEPEPAPAPAEPAKPAPAPAKPAPAPAPAKPAPAKPAPAPAKPAPAPAKPAPDPAPAKPAPAPAKPAPQDVYYANCTAVREAGAAPIYAGDPGYSHKLDRDKDGVACE